MPEVSGSVRGAESELRSRWAQRRLLRRRRHRWFAALSAVTLVLALILGVLWRTRSDDVAAPSTCTGQTVSIAASAQYVAVIDEAARRFSQTGQDRSGACLKVSALASSELESLVSAQARPAALVTGPLETDRITAASTRSTGSAVVAQTVNVVAMPQPMAAALGLNAGEVTWRKLSGILLDPTAWSRHGHPEFGRFTIAMGDPQTSSASLTALSALAASAKGAPMSTLRAADLAGEGIQGALLGVTRQVSMTAQTPPQMLESLLRADGAGELLSTVSAAFLDEQSVWAFNTATPGVPLQALYPTDGASVADLTYTRLSDSRTDPQQAAVTAAFGTFLAGSQGQKTFESMGFRAVGAASSPSLRADLGLRPSRPVGVRLPSAEVRSGLTAAWQRMQNPGRFLVLIDVSGSMKQEVAGTGRTKLEFAQDAAVAGMQLVPPAAEIGLWEFSTALSGSEDHRELVPTGSVGDTIGGQNRLSALVGSARGLTPRGDTGLYDSALAAFREMSRTYTPGEPNVVVLLTDGRNDDTNSPDLGSVLETLAAEQDPARPVRFLTIAYGADADQKALAAIARATKGSAYNSPNPADIGRVFFQALSQA